jgi:hypothetical protein
MEVETRLALWGGHQLIRGYIFWMKTFILLCLLIAFTVTLKAQDNVPKIGSLTGADLVRECHAIPSKTSIDYLTPCTAYILGVDAGIGQGERDNPHPNIALCIAMGTRQDRLVESILKFANAHPEYLKAPAWKIVIGGLQAEFRCPGH